MTTSLPWRNPSCMSLTSHAVFAGSGMTELRIAGASLVVAVSPNFRYGHHPTYTILGRDVRKALGPRPIVATNHVCLNGYLHLHCPRPVVKGCNIAVIQAIPSAVHRGEVRPHLTPIT